MWSRISNNSAGIAGSVWRTNLFNVSTGIGSAVTSESTVRRLMRGSQRGAPCTRMGHKAELEEVESADSVPMNIPQPLTARARSPVLASMALASMLAVAFALAGCSHKQADADRLAAMLQLRPGMVVADVGAGSGWMTVMLGARVGPRGHVFSTEIDPRNLGRIRGAVAAAQLHNVTVVQSTASDTGLPANCCEVILLRRVYHHLTDPADIDRSLFHALRPGGRLAVL